MRRYEYKHIMDDKAAAGVGSAFLVKAYRHIIIKITATVGGGEAVTIKAQGGVDETKPDFSAAQSESNFWDYVQMIDLEDGSAVDGDTGVTVSGSDDFRMFSINSDALEWLNFELSSITGTIEVDVLANAFAD